jgi:DNA-binding ferritin-like protein
MAEFTPLIPQEEGNEVSWYTSGISGIASGLIKVPEGIFSLGAELVDLGFDTNTAADVEMFFDKLNPFEELAEQKGIGKLTEALVSIGVPGQQGFKLGSKLATNYFKKKKLGKAFSSGDKKVIKGAEKAFKLNEKEGLQRFAVGAIGGAAGEFFVADVEEIGTFGDLFDKGPTQLDTFDVSSGREDATRKLMNRLKFSSESLLFTPIVGAAGKSAKALAQKGKALAYSNNRFERYLNKFAEAFTPEGPLTKALFGSQKVMEGFRSADMNKATELVKRLDRTVAKAFPEMQKILDKSLSKEEKELFYKEINDLILDGDLTKLSPVAKVDAFYKNSKNKGVSEEVIGDIMNTVDDARGTFKNLIDTTNKYNAPELKAILQQRIKESVKNTYKIFEDSPVLGVFGRYRPTDEVKEQATKFFEKQLSDASGKRDRSLFTQEARDIVDRILEDGAQAKKSTKGLADPTYIKKTLQGFGKDDKFIKNIIDETKGPAKEIRKLLGEMKDPRYSIFNAVTQLSGMARNSAMLKQMVDQNDVIQSQGGVGSFWKTKEEARNATNGVVEIVEIGKKDKLKDLATFKAGQVANPLVGKFTTKPIAQALENANNLTEGYFTAAVRGKEGASVAEKGASFLYRNLLLFPKGVSQLAKTVFSIPTHLRNIISAGAFASANGILFQGFKNPKMLGDAFRKGWQISGVGNLKNTRYKDLDFENAYRELLELGVVNSQVQIGDLRALMKDVNFGDKIADLDAVLNPMLSKLKKVPEYLQGKYVAEDDFWKITNYFVELSRRDNAYKAAKINKTTKELKEEAADIVRNTVPNYAYVGDVVRTARLLPVGNFMSFPSEMIRSTVNIGQQAIKEMKHIPAAGEVIKGSNILPMVFIQGKGFVKNNNPMYSIGATRAAGMAFTLNAVPAMAVEGAKALYNVTEDEIQALRQFVPEWSRNSTLIPIRDENTGELKYMDFSHSNAYDLIGRPFRTLANEIMAGTKDGDTILQGFITGAEEAVTEIAAPFIDESIWTQAAADVDLFPLLPGRGGRTRDGRLLYTDQTPIGDRLSIKFRHLMEALAPSYKQYVRIGQAALEKPTKTGDILELDDQIAGLIGFRPIKVDPVKSMGFKIAEYQRGIRNARREFTGGAFGLLRGGPIDPNDIITRYYESNKARFNVQKEMHKNINAAEILGVSKQNLNREFSDRQLSESNFNNLRRGRFDAYYPSEDIQERFREISRNLGTFNVFNTARPVLLRMRRDMNKLRLDGSYQNNIEPQTFAQGGLAYTPNLEEVDQTGIDLNDYLIPEVQTPPLPLQPMPNAQVIQPQAPGNIMATGLTPVENALLSDEEKQIRLRQRGLA